jgi:hypothetical protein
MCGLSLSPADFTAEELEIYVLLQRADEIEVAARKEQKPIMPDILKHEKEWFKFYEKLKNYLGQVRGAAQIPILYIVREHDEPTEAIRGTTYSSHTKKVSAIINLSGQHFAIDNASVWEIVKSLVSDGFGWNYVKRFDRNMDGRAAVLALRRQCEGKTSINRRTRLILAFPVPVTRDTAKHIPLPNMWPSIRLHTTSSKTATSPCLKLKRSPTSSAESPIRVSKLGSPVS